MGPSVAPAQNCYQMRTNVAPAQTIPKGVRLSAPDVRKHLAFDF